MDVSQSARSCGIRYTFRFGRTSKRRFECVFALQHLTAQLTEQNYKDKEHRYSIPFWSATHSTSTNEWMSLSRMKFECVFTVNTLTVNTATRGGQTLVKSAFYPSETSLVPTVNRILGWLRRYPNQEFRIGMRKPVLLSIVSPCTFL